MLSKLLITFLVLSSALVRELDAEVVCMADTGGSCDPMSTSMALSGLGSSQPAIAELQSVVVSGSARKTGPIDCSLIVSGVRNLSASIFPRNDRVNKFNMLLQWEVDDHSSEGYEIILRKMNHRILYRTTISTPGVSRVMLEDVGFYSTSSANILVTVKTQSTGHCALLEVEVNHNCQAFVYNQHCSERVLQSMVSESKVRLQIGLAEDPQMMNAHLSWESDPRLNVMVALTREGQENTDCIKAGRNPPCFIVKDTNSVTIAHLNTSTSYSVSLHSFDPSPCSHPHLSHLFNGCGKSCCAGHAIPLPSLSDVSPTPSAANTRLHSTPIPDLLITPSPPQSKVPLPTPTPESQAPLTTTSSKLNSTHAQSQQSHAVSQGASQSDGSVAASVVVPLIILLVVLVLAILSVILYKYIKGRKRVPPSPGHVVTARTPSNVSTSSSLPDIELSNFASPFTKPYVDLRDLQREYTVPPTLATKDISPSVLVLYSPNTPKDKKEDILSQLVVGLCKCGIDVKSPDTSFSDSISIWLEREVKSSTVLVVCNRALKTDWESKQPSQLVCALKQLLLGSLVEQGLSRYAIVFMGGSKKSRYVPTTYLQAQNQFLVRNFDDVIEISHFVYQMPLYTTSF